MAPQQDFSSKIGSSPSPSIQRVIENNKDVQQPVQVPAITDHQFNKQPVTDVSKK